MGAASGVDDMLAPVEKLTDIMYFEVLELLGKGCNGAVFKVWSPMPPRCLRGRV